MFVLSFHAAGSPVLLIYLVGLNTWVYNTLACFLIFSQFKRHRLLISNYMLLTLFTTKVSVINTSLLPSVILPLSLWVGTINWHPPLFYFSVFLIISYNIIIRQPYFCVIVKDTQFSQIKALVITLLLGGLWGLQSLTWGYFWVNDSIEWGLLVIILLIIISQHKLISKASTVYAGQIILMTISLFISLRLNLLPTRHAFLVTTSPVYKATFLYMCSCYRVSTSGKLFTKKTSEKNCKLSLYILLLLTLLLYNKNILCATTKVITISLIIVICQLVKKFFLSLPNLILHYIVCFISYLWIQPIAMFNLNFFNIKLLLAKKIIIYKLTWKFTTQSFSRNLRTSNFLESVTLNRLTELGEFSHLFWNFNYLLICLNLVEFILLLICLLF